MPSTTQSRTRINSGSRNVRLTKREAEVLSLIAQGNSSKEAADKLYLSKRTVDFHLANAHSKLGVSSRVQAINAATRLGLIETETEPARDEEAFAA